MCDRAGLVFARDTQHLSFGKAIKIGGGIGALQGMAVEVGLELHIGDGFTGLKGIGTAIGARCAFIGGGFVQVFLGEGLFRGDGGFRFRGCFRDGLAGLVVLLGGDAKHVAHHQPGGIDIAVGFQQIPQRDAQPVGDEVKAVSAADGVLISTDLVLGRSGMFLHDGCSFHDCFVKGMPKAEAYAGLNQSFP